jgi:uncharacterized protein (DUF1778 family)
MEDERDVLERASFLEGSQASSFILEQYENNDVRMVRSST